MEKDYLLILQLIKNLLLSNQLTLDKLKGTKLSDEQMQILYAMEMLTDSFDDYVRTIDRQMEREKD
ncbi:MAG: hypothetical protein ACOC4J_02355 [Bacteroidota bacterium]